MNTAKELSIGQYVRSKAGRDADRVFIVIGIVDEQFVHIADGDLRRVDRPKRKKIKHLAKFNRISEEVRAKVSEGDSISNALIRREIEKLGMH